MAGRGILYYDIQSGKSKQKIGFFYDEIVINLLMMAGSEGKTVTALRRETGIADVTLRKILRQFVNMNRVKQRESRSKRNLRQYVYVLVNQWVNIS
jgi:hypothetical protein